MKIIALMLVLASSAQAGPYFRVLDPKDIHKVAGAFIDPTDLGNTSAGGAVALITHSIKDGGCILPSVVCEDWSPLVAGGSVKSGRFEFDLGPAWNLTPIAKLGLLGLMNAVTPSDTLSGVKSILGSQPVSGPDVSFSFGPALAVAPIVNGVVLPVTHWQGKFRIFAGAALKF